MKIVSAHVIFLATLSWATVAAAQVAPTTADPSRIETPKVVLPSFEPSPVAQGGSSSAAVPDQAVPAGAEKVSLTLHALNVGGNTAFDDAILRAEYADQLGKKITVADVYGIARKLTLFYREHGYFLARVVIPPQEIENGNVSMQVVEGIISDFEVQGEMPESTRAQISAYASRVLEQKPINVETLERQLMLMNDMPGIQVKSVLSPSTTQDGAASMTLLATHTPWQAVAGLDTFGNSYIGPERALVNVQRHGIIEGLDSVSVTGVMVPDHEEMSYGGAQLTSLIGSSGLKLQLDASHTFTSPSLPGVLGSVLGTQGKASQLGAELSYPIYRSRTTRWQALGGMRLSENSTTFAQGFELLDTFDHLRVANIGTRLEAGDSLQGTNMLELQLHKGIEAMGSSKKGDNALSRTLGDPGFTKVTAEASRLQNLWSRWSVLAAASGQWSADPLLVAEEFGVGGQSFGRGFDGSEVTGDHGMAAKLELQYLTDWRNEWLDGMQLYAFYDFGATWNRDPSAGDDVRHSLSSAGVGSRMQLLQRVTGDIFVAHPLTNQIESRALDKQDDWRMQFAIRVSY